MSYSTQTLYPNKDNVEDILSLPNIFTNDDKDRYEDEVKSLSTTPDFKELHLLINENKVVGFLALKGALPCSDINHLVLETAYVLIHETHRGQKLSEILISKYPECIDRWVDAALQASYTKKHQELIFNLQINAVSKGGASFRKKSVMAAMEWCLKNIQPKLNNNQTNSFDTPYIFFDYGYGFKLTSFPKAGDIEIFDHPSAGQMSNKQIHEIVYNN